MGTGTHSGGMMGRRTNMGAGDRQRVERLVREEMIEIIVRTVRRMIPTAPEHLIRRMSVSQAEDLPRLTDEEVERAPADDAEVRRRWRESFEPDLVVSLAREGEFPS